jgi:WD40 repeat protein
VPITETRGRETGELYLSPEGLWAVIRTGERGLNLWDIKLAKPVRDLAPTDARIPAVAVTNDGQVLAPRIVRRFARLADLATGLDVRSLDETRMNQAAVFSPGGQRLVGSAVGYGDEPFMVWDVVTGEAVFRGSWGYSVVAISACGRYVATESRTGNVHLLDLGTKKVYELEGHVKPASAIAMTERAAWVAAGSYDGAIRLWHERRSAAIETFAGHDDAVTCIAITPGGRLLLSGSRDRTLRLWLRGQTEPLAVFTADAPITKCGISPDGHSCIASDAESRIYFLNWQR